MALTERDCQRRGPGRHADKLNNLYLDVKKDGRRYWSFRFYRNGISREKGLGRYPVVSRTEAREKAAECMKLLRNGIDPIDASRGLAAPTFAQATEAYITEHTERWKDPKAPKTWRQSLTKHAYPRLKNRRVDKITSQDVLKVLDPIWKTRNETASRVRNRIELIISHAKVAHNLEIPENPAKWENNLKHKLPNIRRKVTHRRALPYPEAQQFLEDLRLRDGDAARALELLFATAMRSGSVYKSQWKEFDLKERIWICPPEHMKGIDPPEMRVPLTDSIVAYIQDLNPSSDPENLVFSNPKGNQFSDAALLAVIKRMGYHDKTVVHGLRATFSTWAYEKTNHREDIIEAALSHEFGSQVAQAYNRGDLLEKRLRLMEDWCSFIGF